MNAFIILCYRSLAQYVDPQENALFVTTKAVPGINIILINGFLSLICNGLPIYITFQSLLSVLHRIVGR